MLKSYIMVGNNLLTNLWLYSRETEKLYKGESSPASHLLKFCILPYGSRPNLRILRTQDSSDLRTSAESVLHPG